MINEPKRPAIRWHGGKWRLANWIISHFPSDDHHDVYIENYGGSAAVLLRKQRSRIEVYNDLDLQIYKFFKVLRQTPDILIKAIQNTPFHIEEYKDAWHTPDEPSFTQVYNDGEYSREAFKDFSLVNYEEFVHIEDARRFYVRAYMSIMGGTVGYNSGFRRQKVYSRGKSGKSSMKPASHSFFDTSHLYVISQRLQGVTFENMDAIELFDKYDSHKTLWYIDPPYLGSTRSHQRPAYNHEMLDHRQHESSILHFSKSLGIPLISGYSSDLYHDLLETKGWKKVTKPTRVNGPNQKLECLWLSPRLLDIRKDLLS